VTDDLRAVALRAARGDDAALAELIRRSTRPVWRACAALVDPGSADDLAQDTYLRAVRSLPTYRGDADPVRWLLTIARRVCADEITRRQRARQTSARVYALRPAASVEPDLGVELADAIARLQPDRQEAFLLTAIAGYSYAQAAEACGVPIGTIRSRVARARTDLVDTLDLAPRASPARTRDQAG
jgi:RNA polymerase sigma-70 factor (ECF subfamily)